MKVSTHSMNTFSASSGDTKNAKTVQKKSPAPKTASKSLSVEETQAKLAEQKDKARWARILKTYGLTRENYNELDRGHCPVCTREWSDTVRPVVDHDHVSGSVRGLLCIFCNRYRVGRLRDSDLVQRIADYLKGPFKFIAPPKPKKKRKKKVI